MTAGWRWVDLGKLAKGQSLHVNDIQLGDGIKVVTHGKPNPVIVSVSAQAVDEEAVAAETAAAAAAPAVAAPAAAPAKGGKDDKKAAKPSKDKK